MCMVFPIYLTVLTNVCRLSFFSVCLLAFTKFASCEYAITLLNIAYHYSALWDFGDQTWIVGYCATNQTQGQGQGQEDDEDQTDTFEDCKDPTTSHSDPMKDNKDSYGLD